ncbi:MAG TPA: hypothetical protein VGB17_05265 [Pyrinomonadaceae bacterium]|jgi:hypothetical protein
MKYILTLLLGLLLGALIVFYFLGMRGAKNLPGATVKPPEQGGDPPGTAVLTLEENFFNALFGKIFNDLGAPKFPLQLTRLDQQLDEGQAQVRLAAFQEGCTSEVILTPEGSNVKTGVRFADGKIMAPMAFSGSYSLFGTCWQFKGWAQTNIELRFDQPSQNLYAQINVEGVNLEGVSPIASGFITPLVQRTINERVNPVQMLRGEQLKLNVPIKASNANLAGQVRDIRSEVTGGSLRLHITYDFMKG